MPLFTCPDGDSLVEVNHCHGPGRGHPCEGTSSVPCGPQGECFRNAANYVREHEDEGYRVVHGKVTNDQGQTFAHAWAENATHVVDPTQGVKVEKQHWHTLVQAQPEATYTAEQVAINQLRTGHHGPWTAAKPRPSLGDRLASRAAGMRRDRLARGGVSAEKQRKRDAAMARGRQTQAVVRAIRTREVNHCHGPGRGHPCGHTLNVRLKSPAQVKERAASYGLRVTKITKVPDDGSFDVEVEGHRADIEHFERDHEG